MHTILQAAVDEPLHAVKLYACRTGCRRLRSVYFQTLQVTYATAVTARVCVLSYLLNRSPQLDARPLNLLTYPLTSL